MKIDVNYQQNKKLLTDQIEVLIQSQKLSPDVQKLINTLESLDNHFDVVPLAVDDRVVMVQTNQIIAFEVYDNELTVYTPTENYQLRGTLKTMLQRMDQSVFIQVSKSAVINLNHLNSLEASFSGNMTAILSTDLKLTVSRKYLIDLKKSLGM